MPNNTHTIQCITVGNVDIFLILSHRNVKKVQINVTNTDGAIKNRQSRETGNIGYIKHKSKIKQKTQHNMCWTPLYVNKQK